MSLARSGKVSLGGTASNLPWASAWRQQRLTILGTVFLSFHLNVRFDVSRHVDEWLRHAQLYRLLLFQYGLFIMFCYLIWIRTFRLWPH